jgi:hypothetical protein
MLGQAARTMPSGRRSPPPLASEFEGGRGSSGTPTAPTPPTGATIWAGAPRARRGRSATPNASAFISPRSRRAKGASGRPRTVAPIERRLAAQLGILRKGPCPSNRKDRHVATVVAGVRRTHGRPPVQKEALLPEHVIAMLDALPSVRPSQPARPGDPAAQLRRRPRPVRDRRPRHEAGALLTPRGKTG